jgi:chaperonin GroEL
VRGIERMARLVGATYGPAPGSVAVDRLVGGTPEVLDSGATIAQRTIELADPFENAGAMLLRAVTLEVHDRAGDGTALAAILAARLARAAQGLIAANYDPVGLRAGLEAGLADAIDALRAQSRPVRTVGLLRALMDGLVHDPPLAALLTEVVDSVGADGVVLVEAGQGIETTREYVDGVVWDAGLASPYFVEPSATRARVVDPAILITDQPIDRPEDVVASLETCVRDGDRHLVVIAPRLSDAAVGVLLANRDHGVLESVLAITAPESDGQRTAILEDLAALTGGSCVRQAAGERFADLSSERFGRARQVWATRHAFGILGARGVRSAAARERAAAARAELATCGDDPLAKKTLQKRLANLAGTAAIVRVAAPSELERDALQRRVEAAVRAGALALSQGVIPGGGRALLNCADAMSRNADVGSSTVPDGRGLGRELLVRALAEPMCVIAAQAGLDAASVVNEARERGSGWTFDVLRNGWVDASHDGPVDAYAVIAAALEAATSAAASAISAEAVLRQRSPTR